MPDLPAHASPSYPPFSSPPHAHLPRNVSHLNLDHSNTPAPLPALVTPRFTPPSTPGETPTSERHVRTLPHHAPPPQPAAPLVEVLPEVSCIVRARIPTTAGQEMYLHLYQNNVDNKEHLAIVFGSEIRSRSLDAPRPDESEQDRMIRGAYTGRLYPGRTSSRIESSTSQASPLHKSLYRNPLSSSSSSSISSSSSTTTTTSSPQLPPPNLPSPPPSIPSQPPPAPLVRIHSECYTGETVWSARCDCGEQLGEAARLMSSTSVPPNNPGGVIIYLRQEGRGIGLGEKLKAYNLQDLGSDTVEANLLLRHPADARSYGLATSMLVDLGLGGERGIRLLTNNPDKVRAVEGPGREVWVRERVAMVPLAWSSGGERGVRSEEVGSYLRTKIEKMGHLLAA